MTDDALLKCGDNACETHKCVNTVQHYNNIPLKANTKLHNHHKNQP